MRRYTIEINGTPYVVDVQELGGDLFRAQIDGAAFDVRLADGAALGDVAITPAITPAVPAPAAGHQPPPPPQPAHTAPAPQPAARLAAPASANGSRAAVSAPLPGVIESILVRPGDRVVQGQELLVLEAMKMRNALRAGQSGVVAEILAETGQSVRHGDVLLYLDQERP